MKPKPRPLLFLTDDLAPSDVEWDDDVIDKDPDDTDDPSDLEDIEKDALDDADWDVFLADDDELDPLPEYGDFWDEFADHD
jgi:hypothetical protein